MKAAIKKTENREAIPYYRTSTDDQLLGIDARHSDVLRVAGQKGLTISRDWTEHESGGNNDRPALDQALRYAKRTGATIIVAKLDRLARDSQFLMKLYDGNVPIIFGDLPEVDGSAAGRLMIQMMANFSEFERRRIGERTREALAIFKGRGVKLGASRPECQNLTDADRKRGSEIAAKVRTAEAIEEMADVAEIADDAGRRFNLASDRRPLERGTHPKPQRGSVESHDGQASHRPARKGQDGLTIARSILRTENPPSRRVLFGLEFPGCDVPTRLSAIRPALERQNAGLKIRNVPLEDVQHCYDRFDNPLAALGKKP